MSTAIHAAAPRTAGGFAASGKRNGGVGLAVDPTNANGMFLVLHDTETANIMDRDRNIYMHVLTRTSPYIWSVGERIQVNQDNPPFEADQFMPMIDVDDDGKVHVIFYDDRKYNETMDQMDYVPSDGKFDVFYAFSDTDGASWTNQELFAVPSESVVDWSVLPMMTDFRVRDYIGIDVGADRVFTSFMGTAQADVSTDPNKPRDSSVIWSSQILLD